MIQYDCTHSLWHLRCILNAIAMVLRDGINVADQALMGGALAGSGALLVSLVQLVNELRESKELFQKLLNRLHKVQPQLKRMVQHDKMQKAKPILQEYEALLQGVVETLREHVESNRLQQILSHRKMKKCILEFNADLSEIKGALFLAATEDTADHRNEQDGQFDDLHQVIEQSTADTSAGLRALKQLLITNGSQVLAESRNKDESLADFKVEMERNLFTYNNEQRELLRDIYRLLLKDKLVNSKNQQPEWYIQRGEFCFDAHNPFMTGEFRSICHGTLVFSGTEVTIRTVDITVGDVKTHEEFCKEADKWNKLRDPHVLPLYGANDQCSPKVFVCGRAELGNFNTYLSTHKHRFWHVFLDAARGLAYLHQKRICHANLKCNNLLVTKHGVGVVSDFMFSFVRLNSRLSLKPQTSDHFWKAPERFPPPDSKKLPSSNPRIESDIYSLGMCIYEAMSGTKPYADMKEEDAINMIRKGELPPRPAGKITDEAWSLIQRMCCQDFQDRPRLDAVIDEMRVLVDKEKRIASHVQCQCRAKVCFVCGGQWDLEASTSGSCTLPAPAAS